MDYGCFSANRMYWIIILAHFGCCELGEHRSKKERNEVEKNWFVRSIDWERVHFGEISDNCDAQYLQEPSCPDDTEIKIESQRNEYTNKTGVSASKTERESDGKYHSASVVID